MKTVVASLVLVLCTCLVALSHFAAVAQATGEKNDGSTAESLTVDQESRETTPHRHHHRHRDLSCCIRVCYNNRHLTATADETVFTTTTTTTSRRLRGGLAQTENEPEIQQDEETEEQRYLNNYGYGNRCHYDCSRCSDDDDDDNDGDDGYDNGDDGDGDGGYTEEELYIHDYGQADLGIRFNKFDFPDGKPQGWKPLRNVDYPLRGETAETMKQYAMASSIFLADDFQYQHDAKSTAHQYILSVGGYPPMPSSNPNGPFWKEMEEVVDWAVIAVSNNVNPNTLFRLPDLWKDFSILQVAEAVHDEYPAKYQALFTEQLWGDGATLDQAMFPFRSKLDFLGFQIRCSYLNSWALASVGPITFRLKWAVGRPRPEEIAYLISLGKLTEADGAPPDLVTKVKAMNMQASTDFGPYETGSPKHPAWPAMHSSGSTCSFWLKIILQYCQALLTDYAVAMARTVAGVHYRRDNLDGLNLGQQIVAEQLADLMANYYGSDRAALQAKIDKERFDWRKFDPETCSRGGGSESGSYL